MLTTAAHVQCVYGGEGERGQTRSSGGSRGGSLGSKEPPFCSLNNRKMGVVWLKVGVFQRKLMKRTPPCESSGSTSAEDSLRLSKHKLLFMHLQKISKSTRT